MKLNIRERRQKVAQFIAEKGHQTLEKIAQATGMSKSSVWRHQKARDQSSDNAVAAFWASAAGMVYLARVVIAVIYCFGIKQGVGAESLSEFFQLIGLASHVGSSASAIRSVKQQVIEAIGVYGHEHLSRTPLPANKRVIMGSDETFFRLPILVMMELSSGYLVFEVETENRTYQTWSGAVDTAPVTHGWRVEALVSDGAQALVKLALEKLHCVHLPDVFHLLRDLGHPLAGYLGRQSKRLEREAQTLQARRDKRRHRKQQADYEASLEQHQQQCQRVEHQQHTYAQAMAEITTALHPFALETGQWQLWQALEQRLSAPLQTLEALATQLDLPKAIQAIEAFRAHIPSLAQGMHLWWQGSLDELQQRSQDIPLQDWVISALLPWVYWQQQADKTRTPALKATYQQAAQQAQEQLKAHPVSAQLEPEQRQQWLEWAHQQCVRFQRTSSAIEGRNGRLSRLHHASRGFSPQLLNALTVIHNFDVRRVDGTTPAERLFEQPFPPLFDWLVDHVKDIPLPRKSKKAQEPQPLPPLAFSA